MKRGNPPHPRIAIIDARLSFSEFAEPLPRGFYAAVQQSMRPEIAITRLVPSSPIARPNCTSQRIENIPVEIPVN
ncbi:MAG: hypothetical protein E5W64_01200 [Mesorhizobium sp.]|uniref:hypothetical protein n=1 Tax=unclassified Mesorhizobium TaxID=325217 RepID=UPI000FCB55D7|nr:MULTISPECIES: hypothetical protein [unclassified Mesorhizobium]RVD61981.1 hypothetical protein EN746_00865 [Mesorhizobium sp. M8A.F.Ca.ET.023.02.2.1]TGR58681.1 hypothetical protein EN842_03655 [bacterium M00.F.Ca.ET.199.01.1.1]TGU41209.1 hypothetical protein EN799_01160 [bacterium M00.F.Ca.ET.156.01.1.1]TGU91882.1 hypothetical protein EN794_037770 [Mesorhizobium sp. M00.F.Ca.ET.151.01.1.1]TGV90548.1 hypothetical protein EN792_001830 [Mesorhizobium sp. M00.F.Ca.ET.149.01.1.1]